MQIYALKMQNFFRFRENENSIIFDILPEERELLNSKKITLDDLYETIINNPHKHVKGVKDNKLINNLIAICGVLGDNADRSNGTGKSTCLEAICYAFYERIIRRSVNTEKIDKASLSVMTSINGVIPPDVTTCYVEILFEEKGKLYRLKRGREYNHKTERHDPILKFDCYGQDALDSHSGHRTSDTSESILKVIGLDYNIFVNSVLFGQKDAGQFLRGTDKVRKEMLIGLLNLDTIINNCLEQIRNIKNSKKITVNSTNAQISMLEDDLKLKKPIENIEKEIIDLEKNIKESEDKINERQKEADELLKSEVIKKTEDIKQEGTRVKSELLSAKSQKESQIKEWTILLKNIDEQDILCKRKLENTDSSLKKIKESGRDTKKNIDEFNLQAKQDELKTVSEKSKNKESLLTTIRVLQSAKDTIIKQQGENNTNIKRYQSELLILEKQIVNVAGEEFVCDKCKSKVPKSHIVNEINKNKKFIVELNESSSELVTKESSIVDKIAENHKQVELINNLLIRESKIQSEIKEYQDNLTKLTDLKLRCKEAIDNQKELNEELEKNKVQKQTYAAKIEEISKKYEDSINKLQAKLNELADIYKKVQAEVETIQEKIRLLKASIDIISKEKSGFNSKIGSSNKEIETIKECKAKIEKLKKSFEAEITLLKRLDRLDEIFGLDGIQTRIINKYLPTLNNYIKDFLEVLSDGEMDIKLSINDKTSKVDIEISGNTGEEFNMLSGGEQELARLASAIGLALLSFIRSSRKPEFICLDEVFGSLDPARVSSVFKLLNILRDRFNRVVVISHNPDINEKMPCKILIEKSYGDEGISRIKEIS